MQDDRPRETGKLPALCLAAFLSGVAALTYEVLWVRHLGDVLGSTAYAVNVVLAVFFTGLGIGAWLVGRAADRRGGAISIFCWLEVVVAVWGALVFWLASRGFEQAYVALAPAEWSLGKALTLKGLGAALLLAVPTLAMGGTLPALARHAVRTSEQHAARIGWLYGANTLGAAAGVALAMFWALPRLGLQGTGFCAAAFNAAAILVAWSSRSGTGARASVEVTPAATPVNRPGALAASALSRRALLGTAAWAGFVSVGLEVLWTRALAMRLLSTVYSFATILLVFLLCIGLGSLVVGWLDRRGRATRGTAAALMAAAGLAGVASIGVLVRLGQVELRTAGADTGFTSFQLREGLQALSVMAVPTLLFGLNFPLLCRLVHRDTGSVGRELGSVYLANTVGSVLAPLAVGFWILPALGLRSALLAVGWGGAAFALLVLCDWSARGRRASLVVLGLVALAAYPLQQFARGDVRLWRITAHDELLRYEESPVAAIAALQMPDGSRLLKINNAYNLGGTRSWFSQERQGLIPLLLHPAPRTSLFIGAGSGNSAGAAAAYGDVAVDVLEIVPGLTPFLELFATENTNLAQATRERADVRLLEVDGRHFIRTTPKQYDVVVGDLFVPWRAGEGGMYTREHLTAVRDVLEPGGLFCQWLPLFQLTPPDLRTIARTFCEVFPEVRLTWLYFNGHQPVVGLIGGTRPLRVDPSGLGARVADPRRAALLQSTNLVDPWLALGSWVTGRDELLAWARGAPIETLDHPRIEFAAPRNRTGVEHPAVQNVEVVLALAVPAPEALWPGADPDDLARLARARRGVAAGMRGLAHREAEQLELAVAAFGDALAELPDWNVPAANLRRIFDAARAEDRDDLALLAAEAMQRSATRGYHGCVLAAQVLHARGELDAALALVKRALELDPGNAEARSLGQRIQTEL